jgi:PAS domain S-box-containing protein
MTIDPSAEILRLRATVRDLLALSTIPEAWVGREPPAIAADLADLLIGSLELDFAFVRLRDPTGCQVVEVARGDSWKAFPQWLQQHLAVFGQLSRKEIVTNVGGVEKSRRGIVIPIGVNSERGLVATASDRSDFPDQIHQQLLSVAANNAATAFQNAFLIKELRSAQEALRANEQELRKARDELEIKVAERTAELHHSERELRDVLDSIPAVAWSALPDGSNSYVNRRFVEYCGMPPVQIAGSGWHAATHPDDLERHNAKWLACVASGEPFEDEVRFRRADGEFRLHLQRGVPLRDEAGNIVKWYGVLADIEDRKRAEEARGRNEFYLSEGQRLAHMGSWAFNPAGFEHWSSELFQIYGLNPTGTPPTKEEYLALVHPEDREFVEQEIQEMLTTHRAFDFTKRIVRPDGQIRSVRCVGVPATQAGTFRGFLGTGMDVTEQEQLIAALRKSEEELRQMLDLAPQLVAVYGPNWERLHANRIAVDYLGLGLEEWRQTAERGAFVHPDDRARDRDYFDRALSAGSAYELELRLRNGDGTYRWFLARLNPVRDDKGQISRWYVTCTDIEDRKRAEEKLQQENVALREEIDKASMFEEIVGTSPALQTVLLRISKVAPTDSTVLITGETGTGKELVARAIHRRSNRASRAFVSVNCAAIPRDLIASELFGHEKGAFTGAMQRRVGRFELAEGGTIFLDEVGELLPDTQVALLRVLQEREFERVGGVQSIRVDVRVIAATNRDLKAAVAKGTFREDLYYRLNVFPLEMPPLRARREDIPLLVEYFIDRYGRKAGKNIRSVDKKTLQLLQSYPWPGNIRELQNIIERSVIVCETEIFTVDESWLSKQSHDERSDGKLYLSQKLAVKEKEVIEEALRESQGRVFGPSGAAAKLGIARSTLESKIQSLNINKNRFKAKPRS